MRSSDEQLSVILNKAQEKRKTMRKRKRVVREAGLTALCLCLIVAASFFMPQTEQSVMQETQGAYGSLILSSTYVGYIVIGVLSFALGACLTLLCLHLRQSDGKDGSHVDD